MKKDRATPNIWISIRKQADDAAMLDEKHKDQKLAKRRPKYFDDAEALKLAKEKVEQLKDLAD